MQEDIKTTEISESIIFSVSEVTLHIKQVIETQIEALYIVGEISNFIKHGSGHIYFNLKDDNAVIRCAFFRNQNYNLDFIPQDGDQVVCFGRITVFEKSGQYQLLVQNVFPYGKGALQQQFEQLKLKLKAEGFFDAKHKKQLPKYPDKIGIITSPTGAALQDILNILQRRYPCEVYVYQSLMQGKDAPRQVIAGLSYFNKSKIVDLIIIARGGGSQEDLFCFNDETLARAIYESEFPVVSAIGHEIDFTIADFVSDLRAPTPSAAAELTTPDKTDVNSALMNYYPEFESIVKNKISKSHNTVHINQIKIMQNNPERVWHTFLQRFDEATAKVLVFPEVVSKLKADLLQKQKLLQRDIVNSSRRLFQSHKYKIDLIRTKFDFSIRNKLQLLNHKIDLADAVLHELSPKKVLNRGYSLIRKHGNIIKSITNIHIKDELELVVSDGIAKAEVKSKEQS